MFRNLFSERRRKLFRIFSYSTFILLIINVVLTIVFWKSNNDLGVVLLISSLMILTVWFYFVNWRVNSDLFLRLKKYIAENGDDDVISVLYSHHIDNLNDLKILKKIGFKVAGIQANTNNKDRVDYWVWAKSKKHQFLVEFKEDKKIRYFYGSWDIDEQDLDEEWIYLNHKDFIGLDYEMIFQKVLSLYNECKKNDTSNKVDPMSRTQ